MLRALWTALIGGGATALLAAQIVLANVFGLKRMLARVCPRNPTWSARSILWAAGVDVEVEGEERLHGAATRVSGTPKAASNSAARPASAPGTAARQSS